MPRQSSRKTGDQAACSKGNTSWNLFGRTRPVAVSGRNRFEQELCGVTHPQGFCKECIPLWEGIIFLENSLYWAAALCCTILKAAAQPYVGACVLRATAERHGEVQMILREQHKGPGYKVSKHQETVVLFMSPVAVQSGTVTWLLDF